MSVYFKPAYMLSLFFAFAPTFIKGTKFFDISSEFGFAADINDERVFAR